MGKNHSHPIFHELAKKTNEENKVFKQVLFDQKIIIVYINGYQFKLINAMKLLQISFSVALSDYQVVRKRNPVQFAFQHYQRCRQILVH